MELKKYYRKVARIEEFAAQHPERYKRNLILIIIAGMLPLGLLVVGGLAAVPFLLMRGHIWLIVFIVVFEWAVFSSLFCSISPPGVIKLRRDKYHDLYFQLNKLSRHLNGPSIHRIMLDLDFNAAVFQSMLRRNTLLIGYPLAASMSYEHFMAVLAHEIGHLSKDHNRFSNFVFRLNYALRNASESGIIQALLLFPLTKFYVPFLEYYSMGMLKKHEYEADRFAAKAVGAQIVADALFYTELNNLRMGDEVSKAILEKIKQSPVPEPEFSFCRLVTEKYHSRSDDEKLKKYTDIVMNRQTMPGDPHPSLRQRIAELGASFPLRPLNYSPATEKLFCESHDDIIEQLDSIYREYSAAEWRSAYAYYKDCAERLAPLEAAKQQRKLTQDETIQYLSALEALHDGAVALDAVKLSAAEYPENSTIKFHLGRLMLDAENPEGVELVRQAMQADPANIPGGMEVLEEYLYNHGRTDELIELMDFAENNIQEAVNIYEKLQNITRKNEFMPHGLGSATVELAVEHLSRKKGIASAYLVKFRHPDVDESDSYLLAFTIKTFSFSCNSPQDLESALQQEINFPYLLIVKNYSDSNSIMKKIKAIADSRIWPLAEPRKTAEKDWL